MQQPARGTNSRRWSSHSGESRVSPLYGRLHMRKTSLVLERFVLSKSTARGIDLSNREPDFHQALKYIWMLRHTKARSCHAMSLSCHCPVTRVPLAYGSAGCKSLHLAATKRDCEKFCDLAPCARNVITGTLHTVITVGIRCGKTFSFRFSWISIGLPQVLWMF